MSEGVVIARIDEDNAYLRVSLKLTCAPQSAKLTRNGAHDFIAVKVQTKVIQRRCTQKIESVSNDAIVRIYRERIEKYSLSFVKSPSSVGICPDNVFPLKMSEAALDV
jgi:hypothetical protein